MSCITLKLPAPKPVQVEWNPVHDVDIFPTSPQHRGTVDTPHRPGTPAPQSLPEFTDEPIGDIIRPESLHINIDEDDSYEFVSSELEQEDFPACEETYLQRFRRVITGSNPLLRQANPYISVPVVTISLTTFGFE